MLNFQDKDNQFIEKRINLGLVFKEDHIILEINSESLIEEKIQSKVIPIKNFLRKMKLIIAILKLITRNYL